jgi:hypothetical protein
LYIRDAQPGVRQPLQNDTTIILYGCRGCEHVESEIIAGRWEIGQVNDDAT